MNSRPRIFISTVSKELKSARQLVANTLLFMGYDPEWQEMFETDQGDLRGMLRNRIDQCQGIIHIVGHCYGAEPPEKDEKFGRVSYTQYEALYARETGKKVWVFTLEEGFPTDVYEPEPDELKNLQLKYIEKITLDKDLYYPLTSIDGLEASTLKLRNELAVFRRNFLRWTAIISVILIALLGAAGWIIYGQKTAEVNIKEAAKASERAEEAAKDSALSSQKTTKVAQQTAIVAEDTHQAVERTEKKVEHTQAVVKKAADASIRAEKAAKDSARSSQKTTEIAQQTAIVAKDTHQAVERTEKKVEKTQAVITNIDSRGALDSMQSRLKLAVDTMNLSNQGQVEAIELLIANGRTYGNSKFDGVYLKNANLSGTDFSSSSFMDANLSNTRFIGSNLRNASMFLALAENMNASEIKAEELRLQMASAKNAVFDKAHLNRASFFFSDLHGASFKNAKCTAVNFSYANLTNVDFSGADLSEAQFIGSILTGANFKDAIFSNTDMSGALAESIQVTAKQRAEMTRSVELWHYITIDMIERVLSTQFRSGYDYNDFFRRNYADILGHVPGSLKLRRGGIEPKGFAASRLYNGGLWHGGTRNPLRITLDKKFLRVGDRAHRIRSKIDKHAKFLIAQVKETPAIEGDGKEFSDWMTQIRQNAKNVASQGPLMLNTQETRIILALKFNIFDLDEVTAYEWKRLASSRFDSELKSLNAGNDAKQKNNKNHAYVAGWPHLYPETTVPYLALPSEYASIYKDWTIERLKQLDNKTIQFVFQIDRPYGQRLNEVGSGDFKPFEVFQSRHGVSEDIKLLKNSSRILSGMNLYTIQKFGKMTIELNENRNDYTLVIDNALKYPLTASLEATVNNLRRDPLSNNPKKFRSFISISPQTMSLVDKTGTKWTGKFH